MREILFKAKRTDNGEWVEGDYLSVEGKYLIRDRYEPTFQNEGVYLGSEIDPETVCQYSGELGSDFNGWHKGVFQGDKVNIHEFDEFGNDHETIGVIVYKNGCFFVSEIEKTTRWNLEDHNNIPLFMMDIHEESIMVTGNIHD